MARKSLELKQQADAIYQSAKAIFAKIETEKRDPTEGERQEIDAMNAQMDRILADSRRYERIENHEAGRATTPEPPDETPPEDEEKPSRKTAKIFPTLGHQLAAIAQVTTRKGNYEESANKLHAAATGAGEVVDSDGGFAIQSDFTADIEKRMHEIGQILALCSPISVQGNRLVERFVDETSRATGSRWGAVRGYWIGEGDDITASKVKFGRAQTELEKVGALGYATSELLEDFPAMSGLFQEGFAEELTFMVEDAIIEGNGTGKPLGISVSSNPCLITVTKETGQGAATIVTQNLSKMWVRMPTRSKSKAVWLINNECNPQLDELTIVAGTAAVEPQFVTYGPEGALRIKGRPVLEIEYASALGTAADVMLADFSQYRLIGKGGVSQQQSIHVRFVQDEVAFRATYRVGGQPKPKAVLTPFKGSATLSPFVVLGSRS